jgi:hypothetical protein
MDSGPRATAFAARLATAGVASPAVAPQPALVPGSNGHSHASDAGAEWRTPGESLSQVLRYPVASPVDTAQSWSVQLARRTEVILMALHEEKSARAAAEQMLASQHEQAGEAIATLQAQVCVCVFAVAAL